MTDFLRLPLTTGGVPSQLLAMCLICLQAALSLEKTTVGSAL